MELPTDKYKGDSMKLPLNVIIDSMELVGANHLSAPFESMECLRSQVITMKYLTDLPDRQLFGTLRMGNQVLSVAYHDLRSAFVQTETGITSVAF